MLVEFCSVPDARGGRTEEEGKVTLGTMYAGIAVTVASMSFGAILAIFAVLLGGTVSKEQLKACTFLLVSAFVGDDMDSAGGQNEGEHRVRGDGARLLQPWHSRARGARSLLSDRGMSWSNKNGVPCTFS